MMVNQRKFAKCKHYHWRQGARGGIYCSGCHVDFELIHERRLRARAFYHDFQRAAFSSAF